MAAALVLVAPFKDEKARGEGRDKRVGDRRRERERGKELETRTENKPSVLVTQPFLALKAFKGKKILDLAGLLTPPRYTASWLLCVLFCYVASWPPLPSFPLRII